MHFRRSVCFALAITAVLTAPACLGADYTLDNGGFDFSVPDGWSRILRTQGNPETMVFQVPGDTDLTRDALARVSVTTEKVANVTDFQKVVAQDTAHAQELPHFDMDSDQSSATDFYYTAEEGDVAQTYVEHYYLLQGYAVQVRCIRPTNSASAWTATFEKGCKSLTSSFH